MTDSDRTYLPADYLDESIPTPRASPTDWIIALPGDAYALAAGEDEDGFEPSYFLDAGDVVGFCWTISYGKLTIDLRADGRFSVLAGSLDPRANCVRVDHDNDTIVESVTALARELIENGFEPGLVEVDQYYWSDGEGWRFETGAGGPRFVRVAS